MTQVLEESVTKDSLKPDLEAQVAPEVQKASGWKPLRRLIQTQAISTYK